MTNSQIAAFIKTCKVCCVTARTFEVVGMFGVMIRLDRKTLAVTYSNLKPEHPAYEAMIDFAVAHEPA